MSKASLLGAEPTVDDLASDDHEAIDALATVRAAGIRIVIDMRDAPALSDVCQIRKVISAVAANDRTLSAIAVSNAEAGRVDITVNPEAVTLLEAKLSEFASWINIQSGDVEPASRIVDSAPWWGGARLYLTDGTFWCSDSFRFNNGSQYLLTADHCGGSGYPWHNGGVYVGTSASNLGAYGVDAAVIYGSSYGSRVYTGGTSSSSSIEANGVYPNSSLQYGDQLLISGAASGQGTVTSAGNNQVCRWYDATNYCHLLYFSAYGGTCIGGDSGGPIGVYDPGNARLIASALVSATEGDRNAAHWCLATDISVAIYLWGGGTIG